MRLKKNVFIFPCGSEIGLEFHRALSFSTFFHLIGGSSVPDHGRFVYNDHIADLPHIHEAGFLEALQHIIRSRDIDFICPAHDSVVLLLAQWAEEKKLGPATVVGSPWETCHIARSKKATYDKLRGIIPVPEMYSKGEEVAHFPVFMKPDVGQGSKGTHTARDLSELQFYLADNPSLLLLEYLPGPEYTIDCFTDQDGELRFAGGRLRQRISNGISVSAVSVENPCFGLYARLINESLSWRGAWFFQLKENTHGTPVLMEIAPRIAGTSGFQRLRGINLPLLALFDAMGQHTEIIENPYELIMDRALTNRYKINYPIRNVYIDLDDTLTCDDKPNYKTIALLYKFKSEGCKIMLITRHLAVRQQDTRAFLHSLFIDQGLFDEVIEVKAGEKKSAFVKPEYAVFIDDSFAERNDTARKHQIPVFDVNQAIELFY